MMNAKAIKKYINPIFKLSFQLSIPSIILVILVTCR